MASQNALRAVGKGESAPSQKLTVAEAARSENPRDLLVAMRDRIAETITSRECSARDMASLTKRLQDIVHDVEKIDAIAAEEKRQAKSSNDRNSNTYDASAI